ncbi:hypothetical protein FB2170_03345 [Maribacter sp. HTCC2170]|nr:hypothetical protein FB2170_03345 [Maribacter sp. HTCC2170]
MESHFGTNNLRNKPTFKLQKLHQIPIIGKKSIAYGFKSSGFFLFIRVLLT